MYEFLFILFKKKSKMNVPVSYIMPSTFTYLYLINLHNYNFKIHIIDIAIHDPSLYIKTNKMILIHLSFNLYFEQNSMNVATSVIINHS